MDTFLAIASKRDQREYDARPIPDEVVDRILDAGRLSGNSKNRQDWEFVVVESARDALAKAVFAPENVETAALVVAIVCPRALDTGRAAQNMMLAAWNEGVTSCPNGVRDAEAAEALLGAPPALVLSFGYPVRPRDPTGRPAEEWSARAKRKPLDEVVRKV
ncbi:MAG TPA: nitroreductase family protein [Gaiellaceae bacterium]|jgi:nitroreductase